MTDEILECVRFRLREDHPVMAAMATKLERLETDRELGWALVRITFDGPALPEKQHFAIVVEFGKYREQVVPALRECEVQIAAAMKKSGLGV